MKKILCIVLSIILLLSSGTFAFASNNGGNNRVYENDLMKQLKQNHKNKNKRIEIIKKISISRRQSNINSRMIFVNGEEVVSDVQPVIRNGRSLVPIRAIATALGANVGWDPGSSTITLTKGGTTIILKLNSDTVKVNGRDYKLDVPAVSESGRTVVPLRFIAKTFNKQVEWDEGSGSIIIEDNDQNNQDGNDQGDQPSQLNGNVANDNYTGTNNMQFYYAGSWSYGSQSGAYLNDNHWSQSAGAYCLVKFEGSQIKLYGATTPNCGIARMTIDDGVASDVDYYAASRSDNVVVYTSPVLQYGTHTLKMYVTGTKNSSSTGYFVTTDRIEVNTTNQNPENASSNLALNMPVVSSSDNNSSLRAALAVDGSTGTRWSSGFGSPQWIYADLGASKNVGRVRLNWEAAYGQEYKLQVSNDASTWTDVYYTTAGDGGIDDITFNPVYARYVRMYGIHRGTQWGYSLWEFEVYSGSGTPSSDIPGNKYEAENASLSGGAAVAADHSGYSGSGFVNGFWNPGAAAVYTVNVANTGNYNVMLSYANASGNTRTLSIYVNGYDIKQTSLPNLADWNTWSGVTETLALSSGNNTITYKYDSTDSGNVNLDYITLAITNSSLSGSSAAPGASVNLSNEGASDWAHWGLGDLSGFNHKSGVTQLISNYTKIGSGLSSWYSDSSIACSWSDGTPTASVSGTYSAIYATQAGNGFQITVPADTTQKTLKLYVGAWKAKGRLEATLSDGSSAPYVDYIDSSSGTVCRVFTINFKAASNGQALTVKYTLDTAYDTSWGNVTLQAATLY